MNLMIESVLAYSLIPTLCLLAGGFIASIYQPGESLTSATQHFAAGVVFAAVAKELVPKLGAGSDVIVLIIGFLLGLASMLLIKTYSEYLSEKETGKKGVAWGLVFAVGIDVIIDGVLIGIAFLAGTTGGILIAIALAVELFFLGLSTTATLNARKVLFKVSSIVILVLALLIPFGSLSGAILLSKLPSFYTNGLLAFAVAALLYLVTEELLMEAHEREESPAITSCFFLGFLVILVLENLAG